MLLFIEMANNEKEVAYLRKKNRALCVVMPPPTGDFGYMCSTVK